MSGCEAKERNAALVLGRPRQAPVDRCLAEDDHVASLCGGLVHARLQKVRVFPGHHLRRGRQVELVGAADHAEPAIARVCVHELKGHGDQSIVHLTVREAVLQLRDEAPFRRDGPAVQREALASLVLGDDKRGVVEAVSFAHHGVKERHKVGVAEHLAEGLVVRGVPAEHAGHVEAAGALVSREGRAVLGVAHGFFALHEVVRVDAGVGRADLRGAQYAGDAHEPVQVEQELGPRQARPPACRRHRRRAGAPSG
mmetsp:Transcript_15016/g.42566  ORF Transcript_15016/g.42566 Transcript_15016/m.42566 type:complete len:254 (-) Transcript_15016:2-763(-)